MGELDSRRHSLVVVMVVMGTRFTRLPARRASCKVRRDRQKKSVLRLNTEMLGKCIKPAVIWEAATKLYTPFGAHRSIYRLGSVLFTNKFSVSASISRQGQEIGWLRVPPKIYFKAGCLEVAMAEFASKKRVFIVTDKPLFDLGVSNKVTSLLDAMQIQHKIYYHVEPEPDLKIVLEGIWLFV